MRKRLRRLTFALTVLAVPAARADELFSNVSIDSVFAPATTAAPPVPLPSQKLDGAVQLAGVLRNAGLEPKEVSQQAVAVQLEHERRKFPVLLNLAEDRDRLELIMVLATLKDSSSLSAERLLGLMNANRTISSASFTYNADRKRIELRRTLNNRALGGETLRAELDSLAAAAMKTADLWDLSSAPATTPAPATAAPAPPATPVAKTKTEPPAATTNGPSLVGKWSASMSDKEAFAVQINADGRFVLAHLKNGKTSRTAGKYELQGSTLSLVGDDGTRLAGAVSLQGKGQFRFQPNAGKKASPGLLFKRAS